MGCYSAVTVKEILSFVAPGGPSVKLNEVTQAQTDKYCIVSPIAIAGQKADLINANVRTVAIRHEGWGRGGQAEGGWLMVQNYR